jgi:hypothetical protein
MSISGLNNNSLFNLNNIRTLSGSGTASATRGGAFDLGSGNSVNNSNVGNGDLGLGDVSSRDANVEQAVGSVAAENALQQQFKNQLALVNLQERVQSQSRAVEILTNILKARHDAALSAARNVK